MEIKVITKVFSILEFFAQHRGAVVAPGELSKSLEMPVSTCVRLLKILTCQGYVEQVSRRAGYRLGPMSYYLGHGERYRQELVQGGELLLSPLSRDLGISVQILIRHENYLMILCGFDGDPTLRFNYSHPRYDALHLSVTGRMLLSHASESERHAFVESRFPFERGPFTGMSEVEIFSELASIRGMDEFHEIHEGKHALSLPIRENGKVVAVLGAVWRIDTEEAKTAVIRQKLRCVSQRLSGILSIKEIF